MGITGPACFGFERRWLSKGIRNVSQHADLFEPSMVAEAQFLLGLGKRQVLAVKYWLRCAGLAKREGTATKLTPFGALILEFDPYLEELQTWMALHHRLACSEDAASTYWFAFRMMPNEFTRAELLEQLRAHFPKKSPRTYADATSIFFSIVTSTEISSLCGLAKVDGDYLLKAGDPKTLSDALFAYSLCDWAGSIGASTANLVEILATGGPAKAFTLSRRALNGYVDRIADRYQKRVLWVSHTAGLDSVVFAKHMDPLVILRACYLEHLQGSGPIEALDTALRAQEEVGG